MTLRDAKEGKEYVVSGLTTKDEEMDAFLFTLGCYEDQPITVISRIKGALIVAIKEGRYSIDTRLANAISVYG